jgi:VanZ family protein
MIRFFLSFPRWLRVTLSLLYLCVIALISLIPSSDVPDLKVFEGFDKLVHGGMYFGLTALTCWAFLSEKKRVYILYIVVFSVSWGLLMEFFQIKMSLGRAFEWKDEISNGIGSILAAGLYAVMSTIHRKNINRVSLMDKDPFQNQDETNSHPRK